MSRVNLVLNLLYLTGPLKKILTLGIVNKVLSFAEFKENKQAKKTDGSKKNKIQFLN